MLHTKANLLSFEDLSLVCRKRERGNAVRSPLPDQFRAIFFPALAIKDAVNFLAEFALCPIRKGGGN